MLHSVIILGIYSSFFFTKYHNVADVGNVGFRGFSKSYQKVLLAKNVTFDRIRFDDL